VNGPGGFVIDLEVLDFARSKLSSLLRNLELDAVLDGRSQQSVCAGRGKHEADLELPGLLRVGKRGAGDRGEAKSDPGEHHWLSPKK
jgi:hypothetical protein